MIGTGDLTARLAYHLVKTKKYDTVAKAVIVSLDYYRVHRDATDQFDAHMFGSIMKAAKAPVHRGKPRGTRKEVAVEAG